MMIFEQSYVGVIGVSRQVEWWVIWRVQRISTQRI